MEATRVRPLSVARIPADAKMPCNGGATPYSSSALSVSDVVQHVPFESFRPLAYRSGFCVVSLRQASGFTIHSGPDGLDRGQLLSVIWPSSYLR